MANRLYFLALKKKSNIIISCDFKTSSSILNVIRAIGHMIVGVKLHTDSIPANSLINQTFYKDLEKLKDVLNTQIKKEKQ